MNFEDGRPAGASQADVICSRGSMCQPLPGIALASSCWRDRCPMLAEPRKNAVEPRQSGARAGDTAIDLYIVSAYIWPGCYETFRSVICKIIAR